MTPLTTLASGPDIHRLHRVEKLALRAALPQPHTLRPLLDRAKRARRDMPWGRRGQQLTLAQLVAALHELEDAHLLDQAEMAGERVWALTPEGERAQRALADHFPETHP